MRNNSFIFVIKYLKKKVGKYDKPCLSIPNFLVLLPE